MNKFKKNSIKENLTQQNINELITLYNQGELTLVIAKARRLIKNFPKAYVIWNMLGSAYLGLGELTRAANAFKTVINLKPEIPEAYNNFGVVLYNLGDLVRSSYILNKAIEIKVDYVEAFNNLGNTLKKQNKINEALEKYFKCLSIKPDYSEAYNNIAIIFKEQKKYEEAILYYNKAIALKPNYDAAISNLGELFLKKNELEKAIEYLNKAISINPNLSEAYNNLGNVFYKKGEYGKAINFYNKALSINPISHQFNDNIGDAFKKKGNLFKAIKYYEKVLSIMPNLERVRAKKLHLQASISDWKLIKQDSIFFDKLGATNQSITPFSLLSLEDSPKRHKKRSVIYSKNKFLQKPLPFDFKIREIDEPIRIGYFSSDFKEHPVAYLIAKVIEKHNKGQFQVYGYSIRETEKDSLYKRLVKSFDVFKDLSHLSDKEAALLARKDGIDIAIDLNGYTQNSRTGIFAYRIAPIQINYLGYPGTLGTDFMDYIIADNNLIPETSQDFYSEKPIYLPNTYMPTDNTREISNKTITRKEMLLPEDSFVFCCFNNNYKITSDEFDIWMRLLGKVKGSVLWLRKSNEWSEANFRLEAKKRNIGSSKIIFAERMPTEEHLARYKLADLFVDTFNFNAHTTACEALWAGLPVVTKIGNGFAARVAGSLLHVIDCPELITKTKEEYEALILELATNSEKLSKIKEKVLSNRMSKPLFNTELYTENLENGYKRAYQLYADQKKTEIIFI